MNNDGNNDDKRYNINENNDDNKLIMNWNGNNNDMNNELNEILKLRIVMTDNITLIPQNDIWPQTKQ